MNLSAEMTLSQSTFPPYCVHHMAPDTINNVPATSRLPPELFRPIIGALTVNADRRTLCNVALSSKFLAAESQRVLFRTTSDSFWKRDSLRRHITYLSAIVNAPMCLGPLVHAYTQKDLFMDSTRSPVTGPIENLEDVNLWQLTMAALPAMYNLKHLEFSTRNTPSESSLEVLTQCSFKLNSLIWAVRPGCHINSVVKGLLGVQEQLVHLDLSHCTRPIPAAVCPRLISIRATHRMWAALCSEDRRCIRALDVVTSAHSQPIIITEDELNEDMGHDVATYADYIRLLSYQSYIEMSSEFGDIPLRNLVLLRLLTYTTVSLLRISGFESMRVLVLHKFFRESASEGVVSSHLSFVFQRNTSLLYVDIETEHRDVFQRYYKPTPDALDQRPTVKLFKGGQANGLWWECHLDEADYALQDIQDDIQDPNESGLISNMSSLGL
ncbi:hypothetical protein D9619_011069 [Psilocybe cf. subviscida]|uniref:Uncharacterized protein n=1 Tax=Psilocybe cf. subviscida TaxID=2480587 RepID=A0A8H5BAA6_9AGAR|nr:hypothetical protein D9619_011069 [Psilocybe cf. subviscida]